MPVNRLTYIALVFLLAASCRQPESAAPRVSLVFLVESDPGVGVAGAAVLAGGELVGVSDAKGALSADVPAPRGEPIRVDVRCPQGFLSNSASTLVTPRRFERMDAREPPIEVTLRCRPERRVAVFVVNSGVRQLPVLLDGERVSTTNDFGIAHFSVRGAPGAEYSVTLDTSEAPQLRPRSPVHVRTLDDADEIFVLTQAFETPSRARARGVRRRRITKIE